MSLLGHNQLTVVCSQLRTMAAFTFSKTCSPTATCTVALLMIDGVGVIALEQGVIVLVQANQAPSSLLIDPRIICGTVDDTIVMVDAGVVIDLFHGRQAH